MKFRGTHVLEVVLFVIVMIIFPSVAYPAEIAKKVTIAYTSQSPSTLWFLLEKDLGFFREEGLRPEFVLVRGGGVAVRGLLAGGFDYITATGVVADAVVRTRQSLKIIFTAGMIHYWLVTQEEIRSVTDLKGKTIGTASPGSVSEIIAREILASHGLDPFKDVALLGVGASRERFTALTSGAVHATFLSPPFNFKAVQMGYRKLAKTSDYTNWPGGGLGTTGEKIQQDLQQATKMVRASLKGLKFFLTQREYALLRLMQIFHLTREEAIQSYEFLREEYIPSGYFTEEAQRSAISLAKRVANVTDEVPPEHVFDNRFVKQVEQELKGWKPQVPR